MKPTTKPSMKQTKTATKATWPTPALFSSSTLPDGQLLTSAGLNRKLRT
jgi:hypothetical protein